MKIENWINTKNTNNLKDIKFSIERIVDIINRVQEERVLTEKDVKAIKAKLQNNATLLEKIEPPVKNKKQS